MGVDRSVKWSVRVHALAVRAKPGPWICASRHPRREVGPVICQRHAYIQRGRCGWVEKDRAQSFEKCLKRPAGS